MDANKMVKIDGLSMKFCGKNEDPPTPESYILPIMVHSCPDDFSTLDYFDVSIGFHCFVDFSNATIYPTDIEN
jgi:hypothetical protein